MSAPTDLIEIRLLAFPLQLWARSAEQFDALSREFSLIVLDAGHEVPRRLLALAAELSDRYAPLVGETEGARDAALARGDTAVDLGYRVPPDVSAHVQHLAAALAEADEYCRAGQHLLTLATEPDVARYRRWYFREFVDQVAGRPPTPWPDYRE